VRLNPRASHYRRQLIPARPLGTRDADVEQKLLCLECGAVYDVEAEHRRKTGHRRHRPVLATRNAKGGYDVSPKPPLFWTRAAHMHQ